AICSAFVSVFFLTDTPKYLFTPQGLAVVFAMLASYGLSRTLVPILIDVLVAREYEQRHPDAARKDEKPPEEKPRFPRLSAAFARIRARLPGRKQGDGPGFFGRLHERFERGFA